MYVHYILIIFRGGVFIVIHILPLTQTHKEKKKRKMSKIPAGWLLFKKGDQYHFEYEKVGLRNNRFNKDAGELLDKIPEGMIVEDGDYWPILSKKGSTEFEKARKACNKVLYDEWLDATGGMGGAPGNCSEQDIKDYMKKNNIKEHS